MAGPRSEPDLRGHVTAFLVGNAKPNSIRAHLANGLVDVVDMTPLGAAFDTDEAVRAARRREFGAAALAGGSAAMAVLIPGPEERAAGKALRFVLHKADQKALSVGDWTIINAAQKHVPEIKKVLREIGVDVEHGGVLPKGRQRLFIRGSIRQVQHAGKPEKEIDRQINMMSDAVLRHESRIGRGIWRQKALKEIRRRKIEPH